MGVGSREGVIATKELLLAKVKCDDTGEMKEYVGCKVEHNKEERFLKFTQPVILQSFCDELGVEQKEYDWKTPAIPNSCLQVTTDDPPPDPIRQKWYRSAVGKLLHVMRWSRPDVLNATREVSRFLSNATPAKHQVVN